MAGLGVWSLLQTHPEKWAAAVVLAAYDNFHRADVYQPDALVGVSRRCRAKRFRRSGTGNDEVLRKLNANLR
jgi:hypothetical protein